MDMLYRLHTVCTLPFPFTYGSVKYSTYDTLAYLLFLLKINLFI